MALPADRSAKERLYLLRGWQFRGHRESYKRPGCLALHPQSLRLLHQVGLRDGLLSEGHRIDRVCFYEGDEARLTLSYAELDGPYPFALVVPQRILEGCLEERLRQARIHVGWNQRMQGIETGPGPLTASIARLDAVTSGYPIAHTEWEIVKTFNVKAAVVVGADGYHSFTRQQGRKQQHE
jgi:2-polyprenyl-6-methoxyphenol hydroxylase-like FAD-dependent oxidoreductase